MMKQYAMRQALDEEGPKKTVSPPLGFAVYRVQGSGFIGFRATFGVYRVQGSGFIGFRATETFKTPTFIKHNMSSATLH